jgi:hypothetical protein
VIRPVLDSSVLKYIPNKFLERKKIGIFLKKIIITAYPHCTAIHSRPRGAPGFGRKFIVNKNTIKVDFDSPHKVDPTTIYGWSRENGIVCMLEHVLLASLPSSKSILCYAKNIFK